MKQFLEITEEGEVKRLIGDLSAELAKKITAGAGAGRGAGAGAGGGNVGAGGGKGEKVRTEEALGRTVVGDIFSPLDIPPFDRATMDGYAVLAADTFYADESKPATLVVRGYLKAGEFPSASQYGGVEEGSCVGIATGAPIPRGANAVVKVENAFEFEKAKKVRIYKPVAPAENIMPAGSDIKRGEKVVKKGRLLTPRETGVLAACGVREVLVRKKPRVAVISTGNELVAPGEALSLAPGKIYDVNAQTLCDSARENGCAPFSLGIARDEEGEISAKIRESLAKGAEVVILSGGTSAGVGDVLPAVIEGLGEILVHGVDIKPGKPFVLGVIQGKPVFGLPGNPTSALISFHLFVAPLLRAISGEGSEGWGRSEGRGGSEGRERRKRVKAKAGVRIFSEPGRNEYVLVNLARAESESEEEQEEHFLAYPILSGSGAISTLAKADGFVFVEKGKEIVEEGERVEVVFI